MKKLNFTAIFALSLFFQATTALAGLPKEVAQFVGKEGTFVSLYNEKETRESNGRCKVIMSEYGDEYTITIEANTYFKVQADLENATRSVAGNGVIVYKTTDHGRRAGGSKCGDFIAMSNYRKTVEISEGIILVRQQYRCGFFEKNDIKEVCDMRK